MQEIPNASILAGAFLIRLATGYGGDAAMRDTAAGILEYTLARQNADGSWYYSFRNGCGKKQFDFHQVYMLDGIDAYTAAVDGDTRERIAAGFQRGLDFYLNMFDRQGRPYFRYPHFYPIDIHNVAHGIYFFSKYRDRVKDGETHLAQLLRLCRRYFWNEKLPGFRYQLYPFHWRIGHNFIRWNDAWSVLALTEYWRNSKRTGNPEA